MCEKDLRLRFWKGGCNPERRPVNESQIETGLHEVTLSSPPNISLHSSATTEQGYFTSTKPSLLNRTVLHKGQGALLTHFLLSVAHSRYSMVQSIFEFDPNVSLRIRDFRPCAGFKAPRS